VLRVQDEFVIERSSYASSALVSSRSWAGRTSGRDASMRRKGDHAYAWKDEGKVVRHEPPDPARAWKAVALTNRCSRPARELWKSSGLCGWQDLRAISIMVLVSW